MKAYFADMELNIAKMMIPLFDRVENTERNGENAGYQHFLLFPQCFPKPSSVLPLSQTTNFRLFQTERVCR